MTTNYSNMDYGFVSSPSQSPNLLYPNSQYFDSTSESSNPSTPDHMNQMMFNTMPLRYDMMQYGDGSSSMYNHMNKISVEYTGSSTLDESDRRRRRTISSASSKDKEAVPNMHLRRRAQNRASQRAFRERKEKHVKGLEHQLEDLHDKHQDLLLSYTRQADEVTKLNSRIAELNSELSSLQSCSEQSFSELLTPDKFEKFDAFSGSDLFYKGPECYFDKNAVEFNSNLSLNSFEGSL